MKGVSKVADHAVLVPTAPADGGRDYVAKERGWGIVRDYQLMDLQKGIKKVGIPELIILQHVIDQKIPLFSFNKHFKLMQN